MMTLTTEPTSATKPHHLRALDFIRHYISENAYPPGFREIADALHISPIAASATVRRLEHEQYIKLEQPGCPRTLILLTRFDRQDTDMRRMLADLIYHAHNLTCQNDRKRQKAKIVYDAARKWLYSTTPAAERIVQ